MNTKFLNSFTATAATLSLILLSGCTALNTFPQAARSGDTVALAAGSADGMSRANTTAAFYSDSAPSTPYDLTSGIRGIFRLYADKASSVYSPGSAARNITTTSGHEPWVSIVAIDLPTGLPVGPGKVQLTTSATYPTIGSHVNDVDIGLEILPGTGTPSDLTYEFGVGSSLPGDLTQLESKPLAQIIPTYPQSGWPNYGAIEMKLHVPTINDAPVRVVFDDTGNPGASYMTVFDRDSNDDVTVMILSPKGVLKYYQPRFAIVVNDGGDPLVTFATTPVINSVSYYDVNGNPASGPLATTYSVDMR